MAQHQVSDQVLRMARNIGGVARACGSDYLWVAEFHDGRRLFLMQTYQAVRLGVSAPGDETGFHEIFDFPDILAGWRAILGWNGEDDPEGWVRAWRKGELPRRRPDGKPESEYRAP